MPILTDADMVPFRNLFASLACDKEVTIKRPAKTDDGYGHKSEPTLTTIATVNVLVQKPAPTTADALQGEAGRIVSRSTCTIDFPYGQDVQKGDYLIFTGTNKTFTVHKILDPGSFSISTSVLAIEES